jgi:flagellar biosynthesis/type III secretory pathway protein FliH
LVQATTVQSPNVTHYLQAELDQALREAHEAGRRLGHHQAAETVARVEQAVTQACEFAVLASAQERIETVDALLDVAEVTADTVIGRTPHDGGRNLLERLRAELIEVPDESVRVEINADDHTFISEGLTTLGAHHVVVSPEMAPGETRIVGAWRRVELTRAAMVQQLRAALHSD